MTTSQPTPRIVASASLPVLLALAALTACAGVLTACSTTEGFGKDVKDLGGSIEDSAAENK